MKPKAFSKPLIQGILTLPFILFVFGPIFALLLDLGGSIEVSDNDLIELLLPQGRRLNLLLRSLSLAFAVTVGTTLLGILTASVLWRWRRGPLSILRWYLLVLAPIPPYLHALGWSSFILRINALLTDLELPSISLRGWSASWWVQVMAFTPLAIGITLIAFESLHPSLIETARVQRTDMDVLSQISLPLAAPVILAGASFIFLLSLMDYSVPSLFQVSTYSLEIFAEFSASNQPSRAFLLATPLLLISVMILIYAQNALRGITLQSPWKSRLWEVPPRWSWTFRILQSVAMILLLSQILVPIISQALLSLPIENLHATIRDASSEIGSTWWIAFFTSILALPIALPLAYKLQTKRSLWWVPVTLPLAIPAPLVGIGLIILWNHPQTQTIYTTIWMPILAALARFTPIAVIFLFTQLRRIQPDLVEAAKLLQKNPLQSWLQVRLPLLLPSMLGTAGILFILTAGELGATLLVAPPGQTTLTMRIYNFLHYGASDTVAGLGLVMTVAVLIFGSLAVGILASWSWLSRRHSP
jgi:iron(III) transport system permease protein